MHLYNPQPETVDRRPCPLALTARELELLTVLRGVWDLASAGQEAHSLEEVLNALELIAEEVAEALADARVGITEDC